MRYRLIIVIIACTMITDSAQSQESRSPIKVEVVRTDAGYQLLRGGVPYLVKGAGMVVDDIERFAAHGGNSIRNWTTDNEIQNVRELLDSAHAHGVTVALCLPMVPERHGFDYDDAEAVAEQLAALEQEVLKYRAHPALLLWIIGNELNHSYENPAVYDAVDDVARMIHRLDPNHPTTTTISDVEAGLLETISTRAPALDFLSFQLYGKLFSLPESLEDIGFEAPFMVTEWGAIGYWEMEMTSWGTPTEMTSSEKADVYLRGYGDVLAKLGGRFLGSYAFLWGQKQERTPTWFGMFTETGEETEAIDTMHYIWNGTWPANRSPRVNSMTLDGKSAKQSAILKPGESYQAVFDVEDPENDPLTYRWEVKPESESTAAGGDFEEPISNLEGLLSDTRSASSVLIAPAPGKYRLFAYAYDDQGHAAHANVPFLVRSETDQ